MGKAPVSAAAGRRERSEGLASMVRRPTTQASILAIPAVMPAGMRVLFPMLARRLGARRGYLAGFGIYWAGCYLVPLALVGRRRIAALLGRPADPLPRPRWLGALALLVPPLGAAGTELRPALGQADPALVATAGAVAVVNAAGEELLWRGLFVATFPDDLVRGWLWPAIGFTAWHLAPASVRPPRHGRMFLAGTALIGAGFGWIAWRTRSLRWTLPAHVATDACGLSAAQLWLNRTR
jgi:membrane protease YdiL (CAAX protease family)